MSNKEDKKCKGYNRKFRDTLLNFQKYEKCHKDLNQYRFPLISIRGFDHQLYTVLQNKVVLNNFDSKMYICDCNVHTFFYGSNNIDTVCKRCKWRYCTYCSEFNKWSNCKMCFENVNCVPNVVVK